MNQHQHKILSSIIITLISFFGFEVLSKIISLNQTVVFLNVALYVFLFHIFWVTFLFDLHLKNAASVSMTTAHFRHIVSRAVTERFRHFVNLHYLRHYLNYLVMPAVLYWATVSLLFLNPFRSGLKQIIVIISSVVLSVTYWYMKEHLLVKFERKHDWLPTLTALKLFTAFFAYSAVFGLCWYFGLGSTIVFYFVFAVTFFLVYQILFAHNNHHTLLIWLTVLYALLAGSLSVWVFNHWTYQYFTSALILLALYNTFWGLIHHYLDNSLSKKIALEYLILGILVISIIFASHNFTPHVIL